MASLAQHDAVGGIARRVSELLRQCLPQEPLGSAVGAIHIESSMRKELAQLQAQLAASNEVTWEPAVTRDVAGLLARATPIMMNKRRPFVGVG